jgi:hypothetical protein
MIRWLNKSHLKKKIKKKKKKKRKKREQKKKKKASLFGYLCNLKEQGPLFDVVGTGKLWVTGHIQKDGQGSARELSSGHHSVGKEADTRQSSADRSTRVGPGSVLEKKTFKNPHSNHANHVPK